MSRKIIEIASEIVQTQVSLASMSASEITSSLRQVFGTLLELQKAESGEIELPAQETAASQEKAAGPTHTGKFDSERQGDLPGMRRRDETIDAEASDCSWHHPTRVQEKIRFPNANSFGCKVVNQGAKQGSKKEGVTRESCESD